MNNENTHNDTSEVSINMTRIGVIVGVLAAIFAMAGAWVVLPYRVSEVESKVGKHEIELQTQKEILIRIDENVKELRRSERIDRRITKADAP